MNKTIKKFILFFVTLLIISSSFAQFETYTLNLELLEGGCIGYENSLIQVYYENQSLLNNSDFTVEIYNGPVRTMGLFTEFQVGPEPEVLTFENPVNYFYKIVVPNDNNTYLGTEGFIEIFECGINTFEIIESFENLFTIRSNFDPESTITSRIEHRLENLEEDFIIQVLEINLRPFVRNTDIIEITSTRNMWSSEDRESWEEINGSIQITNLNNRNSTFIAIESLQPILNEEEQENIESNTNSSEESDEQTETNTELPIPTPPRSENVQEIQTSNSLAGYSSLIITFMVISIIIIILFSVIHIKNSKNSQNEEYYYTQKNDNNSITLNTHQLPNLMESRIITYIQTYQEYYPTEQIIEQLINNGFQKDTIIKVLEKFVKDKKN